MENIQEIEIVSTVEITHVYRGEDLEDLIRDGAIPRNPEELAQFKSAFAEAAEKEIEEWIDADSVRVTSVQYFEKEKPEEAAAEGTDG